MDQRQPDHPNPGNRTYSAADTARARQRLAIIKGQDRSRWTDLYHRILLWSWLPFITAVAGLFVTINALFALAYMSDPGGIEHARAGSFWDFFVFSVQTIGSIPYSEMTPKSAYADSVVLVEAFVGILFLGIVTALMFARLSRPTARVVFSRVAIIMPYDGVPTLMFRAANQRGNQVLDASVSVSLAYQSVSKEGEVMRRFTELPLVRSRTPLFALSWTIMHRIDESSPLYGCDAAAMNERQMEIIVLLSGRDDTLADTIYARHAYTAEQIVWNQRFVDVISLHTTGRFLVDLKRFHDTEPIKPYWTA